MKNDIQEKTIGFFQIIRQFDYYNEDEAFNNARKALDSGNHEFVTIKRKLQNGSDDPSVTKILRNQPKKPKQ